LCQIFTCLEQPSTCSNFETFTSTNTTLITKKDTTFEKWKYALPTDEELKKFDIDDKFF